MTAPVLFVLSTDAPLPSAFSAMREQGIVEAIRQDRLAHEAIAAAPGLIATAHLDQIDFMARRESLEALLDNGGRIVVNGHVMRPFVEGLSRFVALASANRQDYVLTRLAVHPVFAGIPAESLETNRGVAGFYGRGHNPPPGGATVLTGLGPGHLPVDWVWERPGGGALFVHSGNDLWGVGDDPATSHAIAERLVRWCLATENAEALP